MNPSSPPDKDPSSSSTRASKVEDWMIAAADEIDRKIGLPRHDLALRWCAEIIADQYFRAHSAET